MSFLSKIDKNDKRKRLGENAKLAEERKMLKPKARMHQLSGNLTLLLKRFG
jgi:hypothetical protein